MAVEFGKYFTPPAEDIEEPESQRGDVWSSVLSFFTCALLRFGFLVKLFVIIAGFVWYNTTGEYGLFTFDLFSVPAALRNKPSYTGGMIVLEGIFLLASLSLIGFQIFLSDNSKYVRDQIWL